MSVRKGSVVRPNVSMSVCPSLRKKDSDFLHFALVRFHCVLFGKNPENKSIAIAFGHHFVSRIVFLLAGSLSQCLCVCVFVYIVQSAQFLYLECRDPVVILWLTNNSDFITVLSPIPFRQ